jgi:predicted patatin/cPLA2 family phospholipase
MNSHPHALVVEGGAMRGIFASGVLDAFLTENHHPFDVAYGVSAGATNLIGFLCGDIGRSRKVILDHACRPQFINFRRFGRGGHLTDIQWLWHKSNYDMPLNFHHYEKNQIPLIATVTNATTGKPEYYTASRENANELFVATCALPLAYRQYPMINGMPTTDGGVADDLPVLEAYRRGAKTITVILSHPLGDIKKPMKNTWLLHRLFATQPAIAEALINSVSHNNATVEFLRNPPADCEIRLIAPTKAFQVGRLTRNYQKLDDGYQQGFKIGAQHCQHYQAPWSQCA